MFLFFIDSDRVELFVFVIIFNLRTSYDHKTKWIVNYEVHGSNTGLL